MKKKPVVFFFDVEAMCYLIMQISNAILEN